MLASTWQAVHSAEVIYLRAIRQGLSPVVDFIYPPRCPLCSAAMAEQDGVCASCWSKLVLPGEPCCVLCQRPFHSDLSDGSAVCAPCMADPPKHDGIAAGTLYNDASRQLVLAFKHGGRIALASLLARLIAARVPANERRWLVVPVPLHRWRLWHRGFNQSALLARALAKQVGGELAVDALRRRKSTPTLGGLGKAARRRVLSGSISMANRAIDRVRDRDVLLVDDVLTSGATSDACVTVLKRPGARKVTVACFARVLDEAKPVALVANETPGAETPGAA